MHYANILLYYGYILAIKQRFFVEDFFKVRKMERNRKVISF
ncbi:MAG: hypothetical protein JWR61_644 [Ferruginibacter sp.]|nr:hypothetical protein [Ferruginibacter sp.]